MKKPKPSKDEESIPPLEQELAEAVSARPQPTPEASEDEVASASIFTEAASEPPAAPEVAPEGEADVAALRAELETLRAQVDEYLDGWQRARAEFANYKKRVEREQDEARARAAAGVITKLLPIADDLDRAMREHPDDEGFAAWADGIGLIQRKVAALLEAEGVEPIEAEGKTFDPELHEAVTYESNDGYSEGQIIEVIQQGYRLGERVLRPARVRVAK